MRWHYLSNHSPWYQELNFLGQYQNTSFDFDRLGLCKEIGEEGNGRIKLGFADRNQE